MNTAEISRLRGLIDKAAEIINGLETRQRGRPSPCDPIATDRERRMSMSLMELGRRIHANDITLEDALREMKDGCCSVILGWSEDDGDLWECSWIVGGVRYTGHHPQPRSAVLAAVVLLPTAPPL